MALFKSMLASKTTDAELAKLRYPVLASPKLDGIRASVQGGVLLSRNLKPIPNAHVQKLFATDHNEGFDGELIAGDPTHPAAFRTTSSAVMSEDGTPEVKFWVFDALYDFNGTYPYQEPFEKRISRVAIKKGDKGLWLVPQKLIRCYDDLLAFEAECLAQGFEGAMVRDPRAPYKQGRSTVREGYLLKVKRFMDGEAIVLGIEEKMHNANEAVRELTGRLKRSSHQANMEPMNTMGTLRVRDIKTNVEFNVGTGFDDAERLAVWRDKTKFIGKILTYRYFPSGSKDRPRFPTFVGWRNVADL